MSRLRAVLHCIFGGAIMLFGFIVGILAPGYWGWGGILLPMVCIIAICYGGLHTAHGLINLKGN